MRAGRPKRQEKRGPQLKFGSSFCVLFLLPLGLPCVNQDSQEGRLLYLRSSLWSLDLPLFYFWGLFPSMTFSHCHFGLPFFLFYLPNNLNSYCVCVYIYIYIQFGGFLAFLSHFVEIVFSCTFLHLSTNRIM